MFPSLTRQEAEIAATEHGHAPAWLSLRDGPNVYDVCRCACGAQGVWRQGIMCTDWMFGLDTMRCPLDVPRQPSPQTEAFEAAMASDRTGG